MSDLAEIERGTRYESVEEAAERLGVSRSTVYREVQRGKIPSYKVGRSIRLRPEEVDRIIMGAPQREEPEPFPLRRGGPGRRPKDSDDLARRASQLAADAAALAQDLRRGA